MLPLGDKGTLLSNTPSRGRGMRGPVLWWLWGTTSLRAAGRKPTPGERTPQARSMNVSKFMTRPSSTYSRPADPAASIWLWIRSPSATLPSPGSTGFDQRGLSTPPQPRLPIQRLTQLRRSFLRPTQTCIPAFLPTSAPVLWGPFTPHLCCVSEIKVCVSESRTLVGPEHRTAAASGTGEGEILRF